MSCSVRGPKGGYVSDEKQQYRESVWASFPDYIAEYCNNDEYYVLLMPSKEGDEIEEAINKGIPEHKIICVDENPAIIAVSEWRKKHPKCKFYGCKISDVGGKIRNDGFVLAAANLDLCNNFSSELIEEVTGFVEKAPIIDGGAVAITIAKGRENKVTTTLLDEVLKNSTFDAIEDKRARVLTESVYQQLKGSASMLMLLGQGGYTHNRVPMTWISLCRPRKRDIEEYFMECDMASEELVDLYDAHSDGFLIGEEDKSRIMDAWNRWDEAAAKLDPYPSEWLVKDFYSKNVFERFIRNHSVSMIRAAKIERKAFKLAS